MGQTTKLSCRVLRPTEHGRRRMVCGHGGRWAVAWWPSLRDSRRRRSSVRCYTYVLLPRPFDTPLGAEAHLGGAVCVAGFVVVGGIDVLTAGS